MINSSSNEVFVPKTCTKVFPALKNGGIGGYLALYLISKKLLVPFGKGISKA